MSEILLLFQSPEFLPNALLLAVAGVLSGILAGLLGIGGGAVMVPVLYEFFGFMGVDDAIRTHMAVGTSLGVIVPTSIRSFLSHKRRGTVDFNILRIWILPILAGVIIGIWAMDYISGTLLRIIFATQTLLIACKMIFRLDRFSLGDRLPSIFIMSLYGAYIGFVSKLMGIGGGIMANSVMTFYGRSIHQAVSTSAGVGLIISVPAVIGDLFFVSANHNFPIGSIGYVNLIAVVLMVPLSVLCAPIGVKVAHALPKRVLEVCFSVFLVLVALRFYISVF